MFHHQHTVIQDKKHSESMNYKRIVEKTKTNSETLEKEHAHAKKGQVNHSKTQKHKTIFPKLPLFSIHPHNTQSHSGNGTRVTVPQGRGTGEWADIDNC